MVLDFNKQIKDEIKNKIDEINKDYEFVKNVSDLLTVIDYFQEIEHDLDCIAALVMHSTVNTPDSEDVNKNYEKIFLDLKNLYYCFSLNKIKEKDSFDYKEFQICAQNTPKNLKNIKKHIKRL